MARLVATMTQVKGHQLSESEQKAIHNPVTITPTGKGGFRVSTPNMVHSKNTTKSKAMAQARLLRGVEHGMKVRGK